MTPQPPQTLLGCKFLDLLSSQRWGSARPGSLDRLGGKIILWKMIFLSFFFSSKKLKKPAVCKSADPAGSLNQTSWC